MLKCSQIRTEIQNFKCISNSNMQSKYRMNNNAKQNENNFPNELRKYILKPHTAYRLQHTYIKRCLYAHKTTI